MINMQSYFFVPASKLNKLADISKKGVGEMIIDFEDAILSSEKEKYFETLKTLSNLKDYWFRVPLRGTFNEEISYDFILKLNSIGAVKIILPKLKSAEELIDVLNTFSKNKFILLIEHPRLLIEIKNAIINNPIMISSLYGLGLGSHDLMAFLEAKHSEPQLDYPRKELLYIAKAYNLKAIDIASMNIFDKLTFMEEVQYGMDNGYDAKFLIHPNQITWFDEQLKQNEILVNWAQNVLDHLPKNYNGDSIVPFILNEEVIEKPHAMRALEIIRKNRDGK